MLGDLAGSGVAEHRGGRDHRRQLGRPHAVSLEHGTSRRIPLGSSHWWGTQVRVRKLPELAGRRVEGRAHQPHRVGGSGDEQGPAGHERSEEQVAQVRAGGDQLPHQRHRHPDHLAVLGHPSGHEHPLAGEEVELSEEAARPVAGDPVLTGAVIAAGHDLHRAGGHHEQVVGGVAGPVQQVAGGDGLPGTEIVEHGQIAGIEEGERIVIQHRDQ